MQWHDVLCVQEDRIVGNDNTVAFQGLQLQIPRSRIRAHFVKAKVRVHQYYDGTQAIFHGPRCLARFRANGELIEERQMGRLKPLGVQACGHVDNAKGVAHMVHRPINSQRSGQMMCYINRTT